MKTLIIGATCGTGIELIKQSLVKGYAVSVLVRNPDKLKLSDKNLTVIKGDVLNFEDVNNVVKGQDAILSALGHKRFFIKTSILSKGTSNIILAMESNQVKRFICITSLGISDSRFKLGLYYSLLSSLLLFPFIL